MRYTTQLPPDRDQAQAPPDDVPSTCPAPIGCAVTAAASPPIDDSGQGQSLFVLFVMAVLFVTGAVALLALVTWWWVLGLAFGIHVLATAVVTMAVFSALGSEKLPRRAAGRAAAGPTPGRADSVRTGAQSSHASPIAA